MIALAVGYLLTSALVTAWLCLLLKAGANEDAARAAWFKEAMEAETCKQR